MDPCNYLRITISNLSLRFPTTPPITSYCCKINFLNYPTQFAILPILPPESTHPDPPPSVSAYFTVTRPDLDKLISPCKNKPFHARKKPMITIDVYSTRPAGCGFGRKFLGRVKVPVELTQQVVEGKGSSIMQNGWVLVGEKRRRDLNPRLYLSVKAQPDPRFVFEFDGEPECSPQVFQVQGNIRQPVFTCKFSFRNSYGDSNLRSSSMSEPSTSRSWLASLKSDKDHHHNQAKHKERKGWSVTVHDLSGSPVAAASMVTPFVPSHGSDCVSKSNPGAWLILRPGDGTWKPWGRLEAWRDQAGPAGFHRLGHKFELLPDAGTSSVMGPNGITLAQSTVPARSGGKFSIDITVGPSPAGSPSSSFDFASWSGSGSSGSENGVGSGPGWMYKGFVMSSTVEGEGKSSSKPVVEVGAQHVTCTEDAAVFVALAAAMDLSMDACRPFSQKLRRELRPNNGDLVG